jgi:hypothetical protein
MMLPYLRDHCGCAKAFHLCLTEQLGGEDGGAEIATRDAEIAPRGRASLPRGRASAEIAASCKAAMDGSRRGRGTGAQLPWIGRGNHGWKFVGEIRGGFGRPARFTAMDASPARGERHKGRTVHQFPVWTPTLGT